ncbi:response regulator transcription factor [Actinomadura hibisca]|uniref:response regulator transcription factor n=1 Tax=Actinomadura hibisca TaxID=68565 RepID=UPI000837A576|nr:response regulator transcription factor [Actinomadura hibisca]
MSGPLRLLVADDQPLVRAGFAAILNRAGFAVVGEAADGAEAVRLAGLHRPDVVLLDVRMPVLDGLEAARLLAGGPAKVIMLTTFDLDRYVYAALAAGAAGFLLKDVTPEHLVAAVRTVHAGATLLAPAITTRLVERHLAAGAAPRVAMNDPSALTARETEVLTLVGRGLSNLEIAARLTLSEATVKTHVSAVFAKLGLRTRAQAVVAAYESGLVKPG